MIAGSDLTPSPGGRVADREQLAARLAQLRSQGKRIVFTNGCFDLFHAGHLWCLNKARELGEILVVGLNSDQSVRRLKGPTRPVQGEEVRAGNLLASGLVDYVTIFDEATPLELILLLKPDVLVKGADYAKEEIVGASQVEAAGGQVVIVPLLERPEQPGKAYSTSALLDPADVKEQEEP